VSSTALRGTVTGVAAPLGGVTVTAQDANGVVWATTFTAGDGTYALDTLPPGSYSVVARVSGYQISSPVPVTVLVGQSVSGINITLTAVAITDAELPAVPADASANLPADWVRLASVDPRIVIHDLMGRDPNNLYLSILAACAHPKRELIGQAASSVVAFNLASYDWEKAYVAFVNAPKSPGFDSFLSKPDKFDALKKIIVDLRLFQYYHPASATAPNLAKVAEVLETGLNEAEFVIGDYLNGDASDALAKEGMHALKNAIITAELFKQILHNLPGSYLLSDPSLYLDGDLYAGYLADFSDQAQQLLDYAADAINLLGLAQKYFQAQDAYTMALGDANKALALLKSSCACPAGTQQKSVNLSGNSSTPMAEPVDPEPG
jgi:hypothetical protein